MNHGRWLAALCTAGALALTSGAQAQDKFPSQPIRLLVGFPAGSSTDVGARILANRLGQVLGQIVVIENRPGASSDIAARAVAAAPPDGYTLFVFTIANVIGAGTPGSTLIDPIKSFEPVAMLGSLPNVLVAYPGTHIKTVDDLIRVAKTKPDGLSFASSGTGTSPHLAGVLFSQMTGVKMLHVPYKGSAPAVADLLGGQVDVMFAPASTALPHIVAGKLTAVASASPKRLETLPNVPTLSEMGLKGFDSSVWFGLTAPVGTPMAIRDKLAAAVKTTLDTPDIKKQLNAQGIDVVHAGPNQFKDYIQSESDKWTKVVQAAGIELQ